MRSVGKSRRGTREHDGVRATLTGNHLVAYCEHVTHDLIFRALGDPIRVAIVDELRERDNQALFELCTRLITKRGFAVSRQAVSKHLALLSEAGVIETVRDGRTTRHRLQHATLDTARAWLARKETP